VALAAPSSGTLTVVPDAAPPATDPCSLTPQGGYSRAENLLYRIEVHGGVPRADRPAADGPRFGMDGLKVKLSRRNAVPAAVGRAFGDGTGVVMVHPSATTAQQSPPVDLDMLVNLAICPRETARNGADCQLSAHIFEIESVRQSASPR
jgi:hypothetical protein